MGEREEIEGQITEERSPKKRTKKSKKKKEIQESKEKFNPVRFLASVLKSIEEKGSVPDRSKEDTSQNESSVMK